MGSSGAGVQEVVVVVQLHSICRAVWSATMGWFTTTGWVSSPIDGDAASQIETGLKSGGAVLEETGTTSISQGPVLGETGSTMVTLGLDPGLVNVPESVVSNAMVWVVVVL